MLRFADASLRIRCRDDVARLMFQGIDEKSFAIWFLSNRTSRLAHKMLKKNACELA